MRKSFPDVLQSGVRVERLVCSRPGPNLPPFEIAYAMAPVTLLREAQHELVQFRRTAPWMPLVLIPRTDRVRENFVLARLAERLGCRLIDPEVDTRLRRWPALLNDMRELPQQFETWMTLHRPRLRRTTVREIGMLVGCGARCWTVEQVAQFQACSVAALERSFRRARVSPPSAYLRFGALAAGLSEYVCNTDLSVERAGLRCGYHDGASFSRAVLRTCGIRPGVFVGGVG